MDFELASMLAQCGLTFQEYQKKGMTKAQLRLSLASSDDEEHHEAKRDSASELEDEPSPAPRKAPAAHSPTRVDHMTVSRRRKEPGSKSVELTEEMAVQALVAMSKDDLSPQPVKRQRVESKPEYPKVPQPSYGYGVAQSYPYYQQQADIGQAYAPQPYYQGYQGYQSYPYQPQPYQPQPYQPAYQYDSNNYNYSYSPQNYFAGQVPQMPQMPQAQHGQQGYPEHKTVYPGQAPVLPSTPSTAINQFDPQTTRDGGNARPKNGNNAVQEDGVQLTALTTSGKINIMIRSTASRSHEETWLNHFNNLQDYLAKHNHYPTHSKAHPSLLGQWCGRQRKHYRRVGPYRDGNPMPQHRIELMELLPGWRWEGSPDSITPRQMANWKPIRLALPPV